MVNYTLVSAPGTSGTTALANCNTACRTTDYYGDDRYGDPNYFPGSSCSSIVTASSTGTCYIINSNSIGTVSAITISAFVINFGFFPETYSIIE
jgi:hypothetical protein